MKVAILGCGQIAKPHINALQEIDGVTIVAVCDRDEQRARMAAQWAEGARIFSDFTTLLQEVHPDVVHVLTPPALHAPLAIQAMEAGCHVLVEKPMALSRQEADSMIAAAKANKVKLCTNHNYLYKPSVAKARRLVAEGAIGRVVYVDSYYGLSGEGNSYGAGGGHWAYRLPGGAFTNFLPHLIYLQMAFQDIESVAGVTLGHNGTPDSPPSEMTVLLQGKNTSGSMAISMQAKPYAKFVDIYGTKGIIHADLVGEVCTIRKNRSVPRMLSKALFNLENSVQLTSGTLVNIAKVASGKMKNMPDMRAFLQEFYSSIREDRALPASGEQGKIVVDVMEQIWSKLPAQPSSASTVITASAQLKPQTETEQRIVQEQGAPRKVLVTGATGFLGQHLVAALRRSGVEVVALVRDKSRVSRTLEQQATLISGHLGDRDAIAAAMQGVDVVYHCAATTANNVPWEMHYQTNVLGSKLVFEEALKANVHRVVYASSVVIYGLDQPVNTQFIDESTPYAQNSDRWAYYLRSKLEADKLAFKLYHEAGLPITVLRLGILYGPGGNRSIGRGLGQFGSVRLLIGSGNNRMPYTYIDNAVDCLLLAAITPEAVGQAYNVVDEPQVSVRDSVFQSNEVTGEKVVLLSTPPALLASVAGLLELKSVRDGTEVPPKLSRYVVRSASRNLYYNTTKVREQLGWKPVITLKESLRKTFEN